MLQLSLDRPGDHLFVRAATAGAITVVDRTLSKSFVLTPTQTIDNWSVREVAALDAAALAPIFALQPEVVILATGARIVFPPARVRAEFLTRGIGVETMDNAAASRTFNVLAGEGRRVAAAFIVPG